MPSSRPSIASTCSDQSHSQTALPYLLRHHLCSELRGPGLLYFPSDAYRALTVCWSHVSSQIALVWANSELLRQHLVRSSMIRHQYHHSSWYSSVHSWAYLHSYQYISTRLHLCLLRPSWPWIALHKLHKSATLYKAFAILPLSLTSMSHWTGSEASHWLETLLVASYLEVSRLLELEWRKLWHLPQLQGTRQLFKLAVWDHLQ